MSLNQTPLFGHHETHGAKKIKCPRPSKMKNNDRGSYESKNSAKKKTTICNTYWSCSFTKRNPSSIKTVPGRKSKLFSCTNLNSASLILLLCKTNCLQPLLISGYHNFSKDTKCPGVTCFTCLANTGPDLLVMSSNGGSATSKAWSASLYCSSVTCRFGFVLDLVTFGDCRESTIEQLWMQMKIEELLMQMLVWAVMASYKHT